MVEWWPGLRYSETPVRVSRPYETGVSDYLNLGHGKMFVGRLAQRLEHLVYTQGVGGSKPSAPKLTARCQ